MPIHLKNSSFTFIMNQTPTFDRLAQFVWSKNTCTPKMVKIARTVRNLFKKFIFNVCLLLLLLLLLLIVVVVVVQFRLAYLKNQTRYRGETLHDDWNP